MPSTLEHHFLEGRKYRQDEIGEVVGHRNWWRMATFVAMGWGLVATLGMGYVATLPKYVPYPIRWDSAAGTMQPLEVAHKAGQEPVTIRLWLREFVTALRTISSDKELIQRQWNQAMVRLTKEGRQRLVEYQTQWLPLRQTDWRSVEILHLLRQTATTWDVRWRETVRDAKDGSTQAVETYRGLFTFQHRAPRTQEELDWNPAGIFFSEWSWSRES